MVIQNGMSDAGQTHIKRFSTHAMADETILAVATGREDLLEYVMETIFENQEIQGPNQHLLIIGQRGMGKSFFMRLVQIAVADEARDGLPAAFVLLPEEQPNISSPAGFLEEVTRNLEGRPATDGMPRFFDDDGEKWAEALENLSAAMDKKIGVNGILIIGAENFDCLINDHFQDQADQSRLRALLAEEPRIMLIATTQDHDIGRITKVVDSQYDDRLFHVFKRLPLEGWNETDYASYLERRFRYQNRTNWRQILEELQPKIRAISTFTGGAPRLAVVLADLLVEQDALTAAQALDELVDELSPYYQDLRDRIPSKSRILFDALIRGGEPCSQSDIAERVQTTQNRIAQPFKWLIDHGYVRERAGKRGRKRHYAVTDRIFVQFYKQRYIHHGHDLTTLASMTEFLAIFYSIGEQFEYARSLFKERGEPNAGQFFTELAAKTSGINTDNLEWFQKPEGSETLADIMGSEIKKLSDFKDDDEIKGELVHSLDALTNVNVPRWRKMQPTQMAEKIRKTHKMNWINKINCCRKLIETRSVYNTWKSIQNEFQVDKEILLNVSNPFIVHAIRSGLMWEAENIGPYENQKLKPARTAWEKWQIELERLAKASEAEKIPDLYLSYESEFMGLPRYILALSMYTVAKSQNGQDDKSTAFEWYKRVIEMDTEESTISIKLLALHAVFAMRMELGETQKALKSANTIFVLAKESPIGTTAIGHITVTLATHGIWPLIWENTRNAKSVSGIIMGLVLWASRVLEHESKPNALSKFRGLLEDCTQNLGPNAETSLSAIIIGLAMVTESKSLIQDIVQEFRHILKNHEQTLPNIVERIVFEIAAGNEEFEIESVGDPDVEASIDAIWALLDFSEVPFKD